MGGKHKTMSNFYSSLGYSDEGDLARWSL